MDLLKSSLLLSVHWVARILAILLIIFISLFALDVFGQNAGFWKTLLALIIHLIPSFILIIIFFVSLKWGWVGSIFFVLAGVTFIIFQGWQTPLIYVPVFAAGVLFFLDWLFRDQIARLREDIR